MYQGCPASGPLYQFYDADLVDIADPDNDEYAACFVDDTTYVAVADTLEEARDK